MKKVIAALLVLSIVCVLFCACEEDIKPERGTTTEAAYINESIGVTFHLPSDWRFYSTEEIAALMNVTQDVMKDKDLFDSNTMASITEFIAIQNPAGASNVNLAIENLRATGNQFITVEKYAETTKSLLQQQAQGMEYTFGENTTVNLGGTEYLRFEAACDYSGIQMVQNLYLRKLGNYMIVISTTTIDGMSSSEFEAMFSDTEGSTDFSDAKEFTDFSVTKEFTDFPVVVKNTDIHKIYIKSHIIEYDVTQVDFTIQGMNSQISQLSDADIWVYVDFTSVPAMLSSTEDPQTIVLPLTYEVRRQDSNIIFVSKSNESIQVTFTKKTD